MNSTQTSDLLSKAHRASSDAKLVVDAMKPFVGWRAMKDHDARKVADELRRVRRILQQTLEAIDFGSPAGAETVASILTT